MKKRISLALCITAGLTAVTLLVRVAVLPFLGSMVARYIVSYLCLALWVAAAIWILRCDRALPARAVKGAPARPVGAVALVAGVVLALTGLYDGAIYLLEGTLPPPSVLPTNTIDFWLAIGTMLAGIASGVYLILLGLRWLRGTEEDPTDGSALPLLLTAWLWLRLARYVLSYAMGVYFSESVFEFVMLAAALLFSFAYAWRAQIKEKHVGGNGPLHMLAALAAAGLVSAPLTVWLLQLLGKRSDRVSVAGVQDLFFGLFVLALLWYWHVHPVEEEQEEKARSGRKGIKALAALLVRRGRVKRDTDGR